MFAAAEQKQQATVSSAEEDALKRNTDCVYFLASPLTCKKGSECEYRHSEYARVNPRDCYFWLNGNCLNSKCGFRHPPLDGLLGTQGGASTGQSGQSSHAATASAAHAPFNTSKQIVPCVFFQKGMCLKGDKCAFLHVPSPPANKTQQSAEVTPVTEPQSLKRPFGGLEKCTRQQKVPSADVSMAFGVPFEAKAAPKVQNSASGNGRGIEKNVLEHVGFEGIPCNIAPPVAEGSLVNRSNQMLQAHGLDNNNSLQNGKDADDFLRESSPGFDVLVDDELRDSDYYPGEDQYQRRGQDEYNTDFNAITDTDQESFLKSRRYESYNHMQERRYGWRQHRASSERMSDHLERRAYQKEESPEERFEESDLRYHLAKQRRADGLRSVVSHNYSEERNLSGYHRDKLREGSRSSRLQGRIKLPGQINGVDSLLERGRNRNRLSQISYQSRVRDKISGMVEENHGGENMNFKAPWTRRDMVDERSAEFPAPKSLAELKSSKDETKSEPAIRKRKSLEDHQRQSEADDLSFEGPLPFSEILKRKRAAASASGLSSHKKDAPQETNENAISESSINVSKAEADKDELKTEAVHDQSSAPTKLNEVENEDQGYEGDDQNGEYYDYEEGYEEDGEYYEVGENGEGGEEYEDGNAEEDGNDDFEKKIDVMFS